jgi:hypothetical protein
MKALVKSIAPFAFAALVVVVVGPCARAAEVDVPLRHWPAPLMWAAAPRPAPAHHFDAAAARADVETLSLPSAPAALVAINPCRIIDTRPGYSAAYTPGTPIGTGVTTFDLTIAPAPCNGIPSNAVAFSLNVTVAAAPGPGYLCAFPGSTPPNPLTSLVNFAAGQTIANASVIPGDSNGNVGFLAYTPIDIVVDINGYYTPAVAYSPVGTTVATLESTTSSSWTDLTTVGPAVTVTVPASGNVLVTLSATASPSVAAGMGFQISGCSNVSPGNGNQLILAGGTLSQDSWTGFVSGLNPGSCTFTAKYISRNGGTSLFSSRRIIVTPVP